MQPPGVPCCGWYLRNRWVSHELLGMEQRNGGINVGRLGGGRGALR